MKIVKLTRNYIAYKRFKHTCGLRFSTWCAEAAIVERASHTLLGSPYADDPNWRGMFSRRKTGTRPFYVSFKTEEMLTMVLLMTAE